MSMAVLQCVAVCCSVLQCVAVCCSDIDFFNINGCVAACCSEWQCVAVTMFSVMSLGVDQLLPKEPHDEIKDTNKQK